MVAIVAASGTSWLAAAQVVSHLGARGGHFAAWEEPELFSEEVRAAFRSLR